MKTLKSLLISVTLLIAFSQLRAQGITPAAAVNNVVTAYYGVKNALTVDNNAVAQSKAKELFAAINAVPMGKLTPDQRKIWMNCTDKLRYDSRHISESAALEHQREHFTSLSKNLYEVLKGMKLNSTVIYEQYCPMKKATWLSETATIKNPYYGKQMPTCGKTTETLVAAIK
jgi:Protein of unknown function (DUF3347)